MATPNRPPRDGQELRVHLARVEIRAAASGKGQTVAGYAAKFNSATDIGGYWIEEIAPGAFAETLRAADVVAINGHDWVRVLGRTSAGTLRLSEDDIGLRVEIDLPDTTDGRDLAILIERGDVKGMSFGFITRKQQWDETVDPPKRVIQEVELIEVTVTAFPQYDDTEIGMRSLNDVRADRERSEHNRRGALSRIAERKARQAHAERRII